MSTDEIEVRGNATAEEIAAVLAMLAQRPSSEPSRYEQWRRARIAAVRRTTRR